SHRGVARGGHPTASRDALVAYPVTRGTTRRAWATRATTVQAWAEAAGALPALAVAVLQRRPLTPVSVRKTTVAEAERPGRRLPSDQRSLPLRMVAPFGLLTSAIPRGIRSIRTTFRAVTLPVFRTEIR